MSNALIRLAHLADANAISRLITQTLKETNAADYPHTIIKKVVKNFTPNQVAEKMKQRLVFVVTEQGEIIGTASLEKNNVRSVFILPNKQGQQIGTLLMRHLEKFAREQHSSTLTVSSSITAEGFYRKLGYNALRDEYYGDERTIIMEKHL